MAVKVKVYQSGAITHPEKLEAAKSAGARWQVRASRRSNRSGRFPR